jgi:hypothetical protein
MTPMGCSKSCVDWPFDLPSYCPELYVLTLVAFNEAVSLTFVPKERMERLLRRSWTAFQSRCCPRKLPWEWLAQIINLVGVIRWCSPGRLLFDGIEEALDRTLNLAEFEEHLQVRQRGHRPSIWEITDGFIRARTVAPPDQTSCTVQTFCLAAGPGGGRKAFTH